MGLERWLGAVKRLKLCDEAAGGAFVAAFNNCESAPQSNDKGSAHFVHFAENIPAKPSGTARKGEKLLLKQLVNKF